MFVQDILDRINDEIVEIVSHYVELKKNGSMYKGLCPFHNEKTASFTVTPALGIYKCFGCGVSGDAIDFIMRHEGVEFREAVKIGAEKLKIDFSWKEDKDFNQEQYKHEEALRIVCRYASEFFHEQLLASEKAQKYLAERNISFESDFSIGYAPSGGKLLSWAKSKGIKTEYLLETGLLRRNEHGELRDYFWDRIVFPICSPTGKVVAFTGRILEKKKDAPKYLNSPDTPIFTKGYNLFALNLARAKIRNENRVYIVEGNFDVIRLYSIGITNVVAPCGTALTDQQIDLLAKYSHNVTLIYDGDVAGQKATDKNAQALIKKKFNVNVMILPDSEDPDTFFVDIGTFENFQEDTSIDYIVYYVQKNSSKCNSPAYKTEFIKEVSFLISRYDEQLQNIYIESVSDHIKPLKAWRDAVFRWNKECNPLEIKRKNKIPVEALLS